MKPYCFVLMPFGQKKDSNGATIDFDEVYAQIIKPAVCAADLEPIRADEELIGGIIHKPMFERLMLCDFAVADLTTANPNVFYELGIRHGIRPHSTILIFAKGSRLPFDVAPLRGLPYQLNALGIPSVPFNDQENLTARLKDCRNPTEDSPLFQLVTEWPRPDLARLKTDKFREVVEYSRKYKAALKDARQKGVDAIKAVEKGLNVADADPAVVVDLFLSYRAVDAWDQMVGLVPRMSPVLSKTVMIQEQLGFAQNRLGNRQEAEDILKAVIAEHGPNSETNGLLGRVYKDYWQDALAKGTTAAAKGYLARAIETYLAGFEADWRDAYPGINAVTLMEYADPVDPRRVELLPVVRYSVKRRLDGPKADYWDFASLLELEVLAANPGAAAKALEHALTHVREKWEAKSTCRNLLLISELRKSRGVEVAWIDDLVAQLSAIFQ